MALEPAVEDDEGASRWHECIRTVTPSNGYSQVWETTTTNAQLVARARLRGYAKRQQRSTQEWAPKSSALK